MPAEVSARLVLDHPDSEAMRVSVETIYTSLTCKAAAD